MELKGKRCGEVDRQRYARPCFAMNSSAVQPSIQQSPASATSTRGSRIIKSGIGMVLMVAGAFFMFLLWRAYELAEETRHWITTPCIVLSSQVLSERGTPNSPMKHRAGIRYSYAFAGKTHISTHIRRVEGWSANSGKAAATVTAYPAGMATQCFVNPAQPDFAILEHSTRAALYTLWFPMLFFVGGAGMIITSLKKRP